MLTFTLSGFAFPKLKSLNNVQATNDTIRKLAVDSLLADNTNFKPYKNSAHASYYHDKFNGRKTASGKKFSNNEFTAAHKNLPFGTKVRVTNPKNKKSVVVTITDRGPFVKGREIDLSKRAFKEIAQAGQGVMHVVIERLDTLD